LVDSVEEEHHLSLTGIKETVSVWSSSHEEEDKELGESILQFSEEKKIGQRKNTDACMHDFRKLESNWSKTSSRSIPRK